LSLVRTFIYCKCSCKYEGWLRRVKGRLYREQICWVFCAQEVAGKKRALARSGEAEERRRNSFRRKQETAAYSGLVLLRNKQLLHTVALSYCATTNTTSL